MKDLKSFVKEQFGIDTDRPGEVVRSAVGAAAQDRGGARPDHVPVDHRGAPTKSGQLVHESIVRNMDRMIEEERGRRRPDQKRIQHLQNQKRAALAQLSAHHDVQPGTQSRGKLSQGEMDVIASMDW